MCGAKDFLFQLPYDRYSYCEDNEVTFLWKGLAALNIKMDIKGAWKPSLTHPMDSFLMEKFVDKGCNKAVLEVLNDSRVYMKVIVLSNISKSGNKIAKCTLVAKFNTHSQWSCPPRRTQNPEFESVEGLPQRNLYERAR